MKNLIYFIIIISLFGCAGRVPQMNPAKNIVFEPNDENEYELIILDPGFDRWFMTNARPPQFYSLNYYENKNRRYVVNWNQLVSSAGHRSNSPFSTYINYESHIDYGLELNYKLFYYFKYIESTAGKYYNFSS